MLSLCLLLSLTTATSQRPASFEAIVPGDTDRATFVGQTGSGKTTLAEYICSQRPYVVVLDPKGTTDWDGYEVHRYLQTLTESRAPRLIYRPVFEELYDENGGIADSIDLFFQWVFMRKNTAVYVDEVYAITRGDIYPVHYGACLTRGREIGVVVYSATQRPARVPQIVFSEAEHVYCFYLKMPRDRERMEMMVGLDRRRVASLPKHQFFYAPQDGEPVGPLKLRLQGA